MLDAWCLTMCSLLSPSSLGEPWSAEDTRVDLAAPNACQTLPGACHKLEYRDVSFVQNTMLVKKGKRR